MIAGGRFRPTFWATVFTIPAVLVMAGLGVWQTQRLAWKTELVDRLRSHMAQPPLEAAAVAADPAAAEYRKVRLTGTFLHDKEMYLLARSMRGNVGVHVVTPLRLADGSTILFNRGWLPEEYKNPSRRPQGLVAGTVAVEGVVRLTEAGRKGWFVPENRPDRNVWLTMDVATMRATAGFTDGAALKADLWWVAADATPTPGLYPIGGQTRIDIPNDHLQYAITWFLLALTLVGVYLVYHWRRDGPVAPPPPERG